MRVVRLKDIVAKELVFTVPTFAARFDRRGEAFGADHVPHVFEAAAQALAQALVDGDDADVARGEQVYKTGLHFASKLFFEHEGIGGELQAMVFAGFAFGGFEVYRVEARGGGEQHVELAGEAVAARFERDFEPARAFGETVGSEFAPAFEGFDAGVEVAAGLHGGRGRGRERHALVVEHDAGAIVPLFQVRGAEPEFFGLVVGHWALVIGCWSVVVVLCDVLVSKAFTGCSGLNDARILHERENTPLTPQGGSI